MANNLTRFKRGDTVMYYRRIDGWQYVCYCTSFAEAQRYSGEKTLVIDLKEYGYIKEKNNLGFALAPCFMLCATRVVLIEKENLVFKRVNEKIKEKKREKEWLRIK